jgi:tetratricopeptide (TPR) repeat protein
MTQPLGVPETGPLAELPLAELLVRLDADRFSGTLELTVGGRTHLVVLADGRVVKAQLAVPVEPLGRILVERGLVEGAKLDALLRRQPATGRRLGELLVEQGLLDDAALEDALVEQVRRRLLRLFLAGDGSYRLRPEQDGLDGRPGIARPFDPLRLLPEGVRNSRSPEELEARLQRALAGRVATVVAGDTCARLGFSPAEQSACRYLSRGSWDAAVFGAVPPEHKPTLLVAAYCLLVARQLALAAPSSVPPSGESAQAAADEALRQEILGLLARIKEVSFFDLLGVSEDVTPEALNARYLELVKRYHPDRAIRHGLTGFKDQLEEILLAVREAFETLNDPEARAAHVAKLRGAAAAQSRDVQDVVDRAVAAERAYQLAVVLERQHKLDEAQKSVDEALEMVPEQAEYVCMSLWLQSARRPARASVSDLVPKMLEAAAAVGKHERALMQAGRLLQRAGRPNEAVDLFRRVLRLNPQNVDAAREVRLVGMRSAKQAGSASGFFDRLLGRKDK